MTTTTANVHCDDDTTFTADTLSTGSAILNIGTRDGCTADVTLFLPNRAVAQRLFAAASDALAMLGDDTPFDGGDDTTDDGVEHRVTVEQSEGGTHYTIRCSCGDVRTRYTAEGAYTAARMTDDHVAAVSS